MSRIYIVGALVGGMIGMLSAHLYKRAADENADDPEAESLAMKPQDLVALGVAILGIVRKIAEAGAEAGKKE